MSWHCADKISIGRRQPVQIHQSSVKNVKRCSKGAIVNSVRGVEDDARSQNIVLQNIQI